MDAYWLGNAPLKGLTGFKRVDTLDGIPVSSLVFIDDKTRIRWKEVSGQRVYIVSDLPISTPLPEKVVGVIPRDTMVINAIAALYSEMRECYDVEDRLIKALNEKELTIQEKQKILLRDSKRYQAMIKNATDLIFTLGPAGRITFSNETMKRYLRGGKDSLVGKAFSDFVVDEDKKAIADMVGKGFSKGVPSKIEVRLHLFKGGTGIFSLMSTPLSEDDHVYALSVIGRDITDIRAMQHRLSLQAKDLTLMINGLSHELRNPLMVIGAYMKRIEKNRGLPHADSVHNALIGINSSIQRIEDMIGRIEQYETMVKQKVAYSEVDIRGTIRGVLKAHKIPVPVSFKGGTRLKAFTDAEHIRDAFLRILDNAVETGTKKIDIALSRREGYAYVSTRDYGPGITEDPEALFAPFFSGDPMKIGLGLTEARIALAKIGSDIEIVPQADPGAVFTMKILLDRRNTLRDE